MVCELRLRTPGIGRRFKDNLNEAIASNGLPPLDWGSGIWQAVARVHDRRRQFVHINASQDRLFPNVEVAENAISTLRDAIKTISSLAGGEPPQWVEDDHDRGWEGGIGSQAHATLLVAGAKEEDPDATTICYVSRGEEYTSRVLPAGLDPEPHVEDLLRHTNVPIGAIRIYRNGELFTEREIRMRGA